jgi:hypothetical protein
VTGDVGVEPEARALVVDLDAANLPTGGDRRDAGQQPGRRHRLRAQNHQAPGAACRRPVDTEVVRGREQSGGRLHGEEEEEHHEQGECDSQRAPPLQ